MKVKISEWKENSILAGLTVVVLLLNALLLAYMTELIWRLDFYDTLVWLNENIPIFLISVVILLVLEIGVYLVTMNMFWTTLLTNLVVLILDLINYFKFDMKGEVFSFSDLSLYKEAMEVAGKFEIHISYILVIVFLVAIAINFITWFAACNANIKLKSKRIRILCGVLGVCICVGVPQFGEVLYKLSNHVGEVFTPEFYYEQKGVIAGLIRTLPTHVQKPENYSKTTINDIVSEVKISDSDERQLPNVIMIMNESLYDINSLEEVNLSKEPLESLKNYQKEFSSGIFLSPTYGGITCQVEYEVLTGYPSKNVAGFAYTNYITESINSLVRLYKKNGYETYAFHPNTKTFFNRNKVYNYMGFDHTYFVNDFALDIKYTTGGWCYDEALYNNIMHEYENSSKETPKFYFIVTTQNHGGHVWDFDDEKYISVLNEDMEQDAYKALTTYANLCKYSDNALDKLLQYFDSVEENTIIVLWGDHAPDLGQYNLDFSVDLPVDSKLERINYRNKHSTPLLIWNNYGLEKKDVGYMPAYRLGAYVTYLAGIKTDPYINFLADSSFPTTVAQFMVTNDGEVKEFNQEVSDRMNDLWLLQYDRMFGKNYYGKLLED